MSNFREIEWQNQPHFERPVFISYCAGEGVDLLEKRVGMHLA
jgi:hypothetical protein